MNPASMHVTHDVKSLQRSNGGRFLEISNMQRGRLVSQEDASEQLHQYWVSRERRDVVEGKGFPEHDEQPAALPTPSGISIFWYLDGTLPSTRKAFPETIIKSPEYLRGRENISE